MKKSIDNAIGIDEFTVTMNEPLRRVPARPDAPSRGGQTVLEMQAHFRDPFSGSPEWQRGRTDRCGKSGKMSSWINPDTGSTIQVKNGNEITAVTANASKLCFDLPHNGKIVRTAEQTLTSLRTMESCYLPLLDGSEPAKEWDFRQISFGGVFEVPFSKIELLLKGLNYPGMNSKPKIFPGQSITFGTGKRPALVLTLYDKVADLRDKNRGNLVFKTLPLDTYTRIEARLNRKKIDERFGGTTLGSINSESLRRVFYQILYRLDVGRTDSSRFPKGIVGSLATGELIQSVCTCDASALESVTEHYLRVNRRSPHARKKLKEAKQLVAERTGCSIKSLIPMDSRTVDLPE